MIRSLKHYFEKKNEFYTENLEPSYTNWNILKCKDLYLSKVSDIQREQSSQLLTEKTIFHAYWHGTFGLKQAFSIKSLTIAIFIYFPYFVYTQYGKYRNMAMVRL